MVQGGSGVEEVRMGGGEQEIGWKLIMGGGGHNFVSKCKPDNFS